MSGRTHRCDRPDRPAHGAGTHVCYSMCGCRCWDCVTGRSDYERQRARRNGTGRPLMVDAEPVRQHVRQLQQSGIGRRRITELTGLSTSTIQKLLGDGGVRQSQKVRAGTAAKLLEIQPGQLADGSTIAAGRTWRRINQLVDAGWTQAAIARHIHGPDARALQLSRRRITVRNAKKVAALHAAHLNGHLNVNEDPT